ncbi:type 4 prepilin-like proteins leader peptide-processing enzyme [Cellvibrio zantedeschiae]|uniref:Prepilin leader peptidase/N-methyltransferase n=1 Tax=Cellvibrio zantedeschiae TaxID=1237077 RepID=A0ABQ3AP76_9GAMM|nr:type 4 prepilin-like proteins leader peptide-processing enzyme [Cellvibrio zantedeschiae]
MSDIVKALELYPLLGIISAGILGLLVGSFLNVVIYRVPKMMEREWRAQCIEFLGAENIKEDAKKESTPEKFNLITPSSTCPSCGHRIKPWENIPVISYLFLRGKCSACKTSISSRYPIIESVTGIFSAVAIYTFGPTWAGLACLFFTWCLIALTMIDFDTQLLPDSITLPLLWLGLIANYFGLFTSLDSALWGAIGGYLSLFSVYWLFKLLTGKEGMGFGDFKLLGALGAWLGWQMLLQIIMLSALAGAVIGVSMIIIRGRDKNIPIPFGPYLAIAGWIALMWGQDINQLYLSYAFGHR